jgi:hypothetical protein
MLPWGKSLLVLLLHAHALLFNEVLDIQSGITLANCSVVQETISIDGVANVDVCTSIAKDLDRIELAILNRVMQRCFALEVLDIWVGFMAKENF